MKPIKSTKKKTLKRVNKIKLSIYWNKKCPLEKTNNKLEKLTRIHKGWIKKFTKNKS